MRRLLFLYFSFAFLSSVSLYAQNSVLDSLFTISQTQKGIALVKTYNEISWEYKNVSADSALVYAKKALVVANSIANQKAVSSAYNSIASSYEALSKLDSALIYHNKSLTIKTQINDTLGIADSYNNLGIIYDTQGNYTKALDSYFKALRLYEAHAKEFDKVPMVYVNIGIVYKKQKEYKKVLSYYNKALDIYKKNNYVVGELITTGNIGSVLLYLESYEESIAYSDRAQKMYDSLGYTRYVPYMQVVKAIAKDSLKQYGEAKKDYLASISAFKKDNNLYELSNAKVSLAHNYSVTNNYSEAKKQLEEAIKITRQNNFKEIEIKALKHLAEVDALTGDYKSALTYFKKYAIQKDSVFETEKTKTVFELETKYETEKKEKEILSQRADLAEQALDLSKKNSYILGLSTLAVVLLLLGYLLYNQQKLKNRQLQKENELKDALIKIETQNKLQDQRLRISRDLHDNIGAQLTFIISSLDNLKYGFKLPETLSHKLEHISGFATSTIYELRDTIWAMNKNEISFEDLQIRISNYIDKANLAAQNIKFQFTVDKALEKDEVLTSVKGMNIYRIIQEAINNALKYAEASSIEVDIRKKDAQLIIVIKDNGKGFDEAIVELGNGIQNMKKRAHEINGELKLISKENKGTTITLKL
jgi:signal transduction histidine kinase/Tfp pilus assembly protein PilF